MYSKFTLYTLAQWRMHCQIRHRLRLRGRWSRLLSSLFIIAIIKLPSQAHPAQLPDIGSSAGSTLSINHERLLGDSYLCQLQGSHSLVTDPLLNHYLTSLGVRLVEQADLVRLPLHFYWLNKSTVNAFALFGGHVVFHTALLNITENESELASVMAHEISHVTQRHLARAIEEEQRNRAMTWAAAAGSVLITLANPTVGVAALLGTVGGAQQSKISFTQAHEQEADRIGLNLLARAGFDVRSTVTFLEKLTTGYQYTTVLPEILMTHPLPESRMADIRVRVQRLPLHQVGSSLAYSLAKIRMRVLYSASGSKNRVHSQPLLQPAKVSATDMFQKNGLQKIVTAYSTALQAYQAKAFNTARAALKPLLIEFPDEIWFIDLITDIDLEQQQYAVAIARLQQALKNNPNHQVLQLNLANVYLKNGAARQAIALLRQYSETYPQDVNGWHLLAAAYSTLRIIDEAHAARAELLALQGQFDAAIAALQLACRSERVKQPTVMRYQARIEQLKQLQQRYNQARKIL